MSSGTFGYCAGCNLEFAAEHFDSCPVCLAPRVEGARRPWSRTEFLFRNFGDKSQPILRMHANQAVVNKNLWLVCAIAGGMMVISLCLFASREFRAGATLETGILVGCCLAAVIATIVGLVALSLKNLRPVEILQDGSLRIPRAMALSRSVTGNLVIAAVRASRDAAERSHHKLASSEWLPFVERMETDETLSLVEELVAPGTRQFFRHVDSQIAEVRYALRALARR